MALGTGSPAIVSWPELRGICTAIASSVKCTLLISSLDHLQGFPHPLSLSTKAGTAIKGQLKHHKSCQLEARVQGVTELVPPPPVPATEESTDGVGLSSHYRRSLLL